SSGAAVTVYDLRRASLRGRRYAAVLLRSPFFFAGALPTDIYTLSLHDALPISWLVLGVGSYLVVDHQLAGVFLAMLVMTSLTVRSEEHTSELQSRFDLVCRLLLEKKKKYTLIFGACLDVGKLLVGCNVLTVLCE